MNRKLALVVLTFIASLSNPLNAQQAADGFAPEIATGVSATKMQTAKKFMISAANPIAAKIGHDVLARGGNAIDAMVATQFAPRSSRAAVFRPWWGVRS